MGTEHFRDSSLNRNIKIPLSTIQFHNDISSGSEKSVVMHYVGPGEAEGDAE